MSRYLKKIILRKKNNLKYDNPNYDNLDSSLLDNNNHSDNNHSDNNHSDNNHSEDNHSDNNHSEDNHSDNNHSEDNHTINNFRDELLKCDNNTEMFSLEGQYKLCKVVDVYDGDTIKVVFDLNGAFYKWNIRMLGYNSHEMRVSTNNPERDTIKNLAIAERDFLRELIFNENQLVYILCDGFDKYGRLLGTVYLNEKDTVSVNQLMIDNHKGVVYDI
jgi:endonuclease YncB( thermonuclease family)